jgi:hypothetical protein
MPNHLIMLDADEFDARRGYTRWILPQTGAILGNREANADLWTDRDGRLFVRFSSSGYVYHYEIQSSTQPVITEDLHDAVYDFLQEQLVTWVVGGVDDSVLNM